MSFSWDCLLCLSLCGRGYSKNSKSWCSSGGGISWHQPPPPPSWIRGLYTLELPEVSVPFSYMSFNCLVLRFLSQNSLSKSPTPEVYWSHAISGSWTTLCGQGSPNSTWEGRGKKSKQNQTDGQNSKRSGVRPVPSHTTCPLRLHPYGLLTNFSWRHRSNDSSLVDKMLLQTLRSEADKCYSMENRSFFFFFLGVQL